MSSRKVYIEGLQSASQRSGWQVRMSSESERQMLNNSPPSIQHVQEEDNQGSIQPNVARQNVSFKRLLCFFNSIKLSSCWT